MQYGIGLRRGPAESLRRRRQCDHPIHESQVFSRPGVSSLSVLRASASSIGAVVSPQRQDHAAKPRIDLPINLGPPDRRWFVRTCRTRPIRVRPERGVLNAKPGSCDTLSLQPYLAEKSRGRPDQRRTGLHAARRARRLPVIGERRLRSTAAVVTVHHRAVRQVPAPPRSDLWHGT